MARFIDLLQRHSVGQFAKSMTKDMQILVADAIYQEMDEATHHGRVWQPADFPRAAPPFPRLWIEGRLNGGLWGGVSVTVLESRDVNAEILALCRIRSQDFRWLVTMYSLSAGNEKHGKLQTLLVGSHLQFMALDDAGTVVAGLATPILKPAPDVEAVMLKVLKQPRMGFSVQVNVAPIVLKVFALMNCVNVQATLIAPPRALSKSHQKKYLVPMSTYKVLTVKGVSISQRVGAGHGGRHTSPRMHIVRGHFKHLKSGKTAWWESHLRGRDDDGTIKKRYNVVAPDPLTVGVTPPDRKA